MISKKSAIVLVLPWVIVLQFIQNLNENIYNVITPNIMETFHLTTSQVSWVLSIAFFAFGIGGGIFSICTDIFDMRRLYLIGILLMIIGSLLGFFLGYSYGFVLLARVFQTFGESVIIGASTILIARYAPIEKKALFFGLITASYQLSAGLGHYIGGYISTYFSWRYCMLIPLLTLICVPHFIRYLPRTIEQTKKLDGFGVALMAVSVFFWMSTLDTFSRKTLVWAMVLTGVFILWSVFTEKKRKMPFLPMSVFKNKKVLGMIMISLLIYSVQNGIFFMFPFIVTEIFHRSTAIIGMMYLPTNFLACVVGVLAGRFVLKFGRGKVFGIAIFGIILGFIIFMIGIGNGQLLWVEIGLFLFSSGYPLLFVSYYDLISAIIPSEILGLSIGAMNIMTNIFSSLFISVVASLLSSNILTKFVIIKSKHVEIDNLLMIYIVILLCGVTIYHLLNKKQKLKGEQK